MIATFTMVENTMNDGLSYHHENHQFNGTSNTKQDQKNGEMDPVVCHSILKVVPYRMTLPYQWLKVLLQLIKKMGLLSFQCIILNIFGSLLFISFYESIIVSLDHSYLFFINWTIRLAASTVTGMNC